MKDKIVLQDKLTDAFIQYQWNLENPFPQLMRFNSNISQPPWVAQYLSDTMFHAKVDKLVAGVMHIVSDWEEAGE